MSERGSKQDRSVSTVLDTVTKTVQLSMTNDQLTCFIISLDIQYKQYARRIPVASFVSDNVSKEHVHTACHQFIHSFIDLACVRVVYDEVSLKNGNDYDAKQQLRSRRKRNGVLCTLVLVQHSSEHTQGGRRWYLDHAQCK